MALEWVIIAGALFVGLALGILIVLPFSMKRRRKEISHEVVAEEFPAPSAMRPPQVRRSPPPPERVEVEFQVEDFGVAADPLRADPPRPRAGPAMMPRSPPPPEDAIPTEWARRFTGEAEAGRAKGICSGCGTKLSVGMQRPLRIACPVCGRQRLLT